MDDTSHATDSGLRAEEKLLISTVSDEALEKAAGGAQPYPGTGVATICVLESPFPKKFGRQVEGS